jgi:hypothetical protein
MQQADNSSQRSDPTPVPAPLHSKDVEDVTVDLRGEILLDHLAGPRCHHSCPYVREERGCQTLCTKGRGNVATGTES